MRKKLLTILFSVASLIVFSQDMQLLKNYKYRINNYKNLIIDLFGTGKKINYNENEAPQSTSFYQNITNISMGVYYGNWKSTDKTLRRYSISMPTSFSYAKSGSFSGANETKIISLGGGFSFNSKNFNKKIFKEIGFDLSSSYSHYLLPAFAAPFESYVPQNANTKSLRLGTTFGIGNGRIENVRDMHNALWLIKTLQEQGNLKKDLTTSEINDLAKTITHSNNGRVLDGRKRIQTILESVDTFLQGKKFISKKDFDNFPNLESVLFSNNYRRLSGTERYIRLQPLVTGSYGTAIGKVLNTALIELKVGIEKHLPLGLKRQFDYGVALNAGYRWSESLNFRKASIVTNDTRKFGLEYFLRYNIYPNARTSVNFSLAGDNGYLESYLQEKAYTVNTLSASGSYFIKNNTQLNFSIGCINGVNNFGYFNNYIPTYKPENIHPFISVGINKSL
jgi:hypothetical protein